MRQDSLYYPSEHDLKRFVRYERRRVSPWHSLMADLHHLSARNCLLPVVSVLFGYKVPSYNWRLLSRDELLAIFQTTLGGAILPFLFYLPHASFT